MTVTGSRSPRHRGIHDVAGSFYAAIKAGTIAVAPFAPNRRATSNVSIWRSAIVARSRTDDIWRLRTRRGASWSTCDSGQKPHTPSSSMSYTLFDAAVSVPVELVIDRCFRICSTPRVRHVPPVGVEDRPPGGGSDPAQMILSIHSCTGTCHGVS